MARRKLLLSGREAEILTLIQQGRSLREAAEFLGVSPKTLSRHLERMCKRSGVANHVKLAELTWYIRMAVAHGLIDPSG